MSCHLLAVALALWMAHRSDWMMRRAERRRLSRQPVNWVSRTTGRFASLIHHINHANFSMSRTEAGSPLALFVECGSHDASGRFALFMRNINHANFSMSRTEAGSPLTLFVECGLHAAPGRFASFMRHIDHANFSMSRTEAGLPFALCVECGSHAASGRCASFIHHIDHANFSMSRTEAGLPFALDVETCVFTANVGFACPRHVALCSLNHSPSNLMAAQP